MACQNNIWILFEERPKVEVIKKILQIYCDDFNYKIEAKNKLESAIYEMEEIFEDPLRDLNNKIDEIEYDLEYPEG